MEYEELREAAIGFSKKTQAASENSSNYGYGVLAFGAALATAAFLYKNNKQKQATFVAEKEPLNNGELDEDEEFQMV